MKTSRIYPPWWEITLTIYNKHQDKQTQVVTWYKTILKNCFWKDASNKVLIGDTLLETNSIICRIPYDDRFREKHEWEALPNDQKGNFFTIGQEDIIVKGEVADTINEYVAGERSSDLLAKYKELQGCMSVQRSSINTGTARCSEHYYVTGT